MKTIRQRVTVEMKPSEVYELFMDSRKHSKLIGGKVSMSRKVGGKFSAFDGWLEGKNLELVKNKKIVQTWRGSDWPEGVNSKVTFKLIKVSKGCRIELTHSGIPDSAAKGVKQGWYDYYWNNLKV